MICDSGDHASILDGCRLSGAKLRPFRHNRMDKLERMLERAAEDGGGVLVVVDGVFSMEGDVCPLPRIVELCQAHGARLMVDEAHGVGVLGARGAGACELFGVEDEVDLRMGTFSKSLASCGGFIAGPADVIEYLRIASRSFMFTASAVPAAVGAALEALRVIRAEGRALFAKLLDNAAYLREGLRDLGLKVVEPGTLPDGSVATTPVVPVIVGDDWQAVLLWKALFDAGVYTNVALHPAVPPGGALLRTSLMATHEREHLDGALGTIARVIEDFPDLPSRLTEVLHPPSWVVSGLSRSGQGPAARKKLLLANGPGQVSRSRVDAPHPDGIACATADRTRGRERTVERFGSTEATDLPSARRRERYPVNRSL